MTTEGRNNWFIRTVLQVEHTDQNWKKSVTWRYQRLWRPRMKSQKWLLRALSLKILKILPRNKILNESHSKTLAFRDVVFVRPRWLLQPIRTPHLCWVAQTRTRPRATNVCASAVEIRELAAGCSASYYRKLSPFNRHQIRKEVVLRKKKCFESNAENRT